MFKTVNPYDVVVGKLLFPSAAPPSSEQTTRRARADAPRPHRHSCPLRLLPPAAQRKPPTRTRRARTGRSSSPSGRRSTRTARLGEYLATGSRVLAEDGARSGSWPLPLACPLLQGNLGGICDSDRSPRVASGSAEPSLVPTPLRDPLAVHTPPKRSLTRLPSARNCVNALQKRLGHRNANVQLFSLSVRAIPLRLPPVRTADPGPTARRLAYQQLRSTAPPRDLRTELHLGPRAPCQRPRASRLRARPPRDAAESHVVIVAAEHPRWSQEAYSEAHRELGEGTRQEPRL